MIIDDKIITINIPQKAKPRSSTTLTMAGGGIIYFTPSGFCNRLFTHFYNPFTPSGFEK